MRTRIFFSVNNTDFLSCPELSNYRIFVFTRSVADSHGFSFLSRIRELSNFVFTRNITDSHGFSFFFFLVPNYRISITRNIADGHGFSFLVPNYRIIEFQSHGISRIVTDFLFFFSCPELSNYRILSSHGISRTVTDFLSRIIEFQSHG